ncbi:hypothetical protein CSUI_006990 [Cystoisospora suis]|uniref:Secreted protein n=1 Tax=Cystoisospora suis TaxID=483139 RepID=A0A2C6KS53_9APIC|nr:hypothetical protein CSUI_006990 [Cystoisospora suis]
MRAFFFAVLVAPGTCSGLPSQLEQLGLAVHCTWASDKCSSLHGLARFKRETLFCLYARAAVQSASRS